MFDSLIQDLVLKYQNQSPSTEEILTELYNNSVLKEKYLNEIYKCSIIISLLIK